MARAKRLTYGAVNITIHPHSPEEYVNLFRDAYTSGLNVNLSGDVYGTMRLFSRVPGHNEKTDPYSGEIVKYTHIDKNGDWYSIKSKDLATDKEKAGINIPDDLKPNVNQFSFVFLPKYHLFVYQASNGGKNLSHLQVEKYLTRLFSQPDLEKKYGVVNVTSLTEPDEVEKMLSLSGIKKITMVTRRPNPDDLMKAEKKVQKRLKALNVIEEEKTLKSERTSAITPDHELKLEGQIAARNGKLNVKAVDYKGHVQEYSSLEKPLKRIESFDPNVQTVVDVLLEKAHSIYDDFRKWLAK
ncbi:MULTISPECIES: DUF4747 family protein [Providencia]|uniref:DUF4747 family protein n=1 Tax=Providencia TaxID=586 RepID=UPI001123364D|nr:DUF4747 family protein [Providencia manganoxydans]MDX4947174.1 DUF4747 family protein [Providencia manganoxydans]